MPDVWFRYNAKAVRGRQIKLLEKDIQKRFAEILHVEPDHIAVQRQKVKGTGLLDLDVIVGTSLLPVGYVRETVATPAAEAGEVGPENPSVLQSELQAIMEDDPDEQEATLDALQSRTDASEPLADALMDIVMKGGLHLPAVLPLRSEKGELVERGYPEEGVAVRGVRTIGIRTAVGTGKFTMRTVPGTVDLPAPGLI